jgi:hypothetical protein
VPGRGTTNERKTYTYQDSKLKNGKYQYRLKQIDFNGNYEFFQMSGDIAVLAPAVFDMSQNYPNPSNPRSRIEYQIPVSGKVTIKLFDVLGREVSTILNEKKEAGYYIAEFDGTNIASGIYFYRINAEGDGHTYIKTMKMVLVK